jgi:hypothetical protein
LTGTPTAPTAAAGTKTTQLATTQFVADAQVFKRTGTVLEPVTAGDTIKGNLLPTNGSLGFRNVIINGDMRINQRGVTIAAAAVGQYGPDRWKKVDAGNMTQIIESGNFVPGATYTLSGTGVTTQQLTAPSTGHWTLPNIPITATNIQLERGTIATPFELRDVALEIVMCLRYYEKSYEDSEQPGTVQFDGQEDRVTAGTNAGVNSVSVKLKGKKRVPPTLTIYSPGTGASARGLAYAAGGGSANSDVAAASKHITTSSFAVDFSAYAANAFSCVTFHYVADAEI